MSILVILFVALLPVAALLWYIYKTDPVSEPIQQLSRAFLYGCLIVIPVGAVEELLSLVLAPFLEIPLFGAIGEGFLIAAIPEEGAKLLALWFLLRKNPYFDEHFDGIVYAVYVSLGFAAIENIGYLYTNIDSLLAVGFMRALLAVPGHYAFGVLMGYFYSLYYFVNRSQRNKTMILVAPVLAHGTYDSILFVSNLTPTFGAISFFGIIYFCIRLHKFCYKRIQNHIHRDNMYFGL
jgi:RsiW-degrading membrane proteinase PrsW (M82 family)